MTSFTFGKFKSKTISEVFKNNYYYIDWICKQNWFQNNFKEQYNECINLLNHRKYLQENAQVNSDDIIVYTDGACRKNGTPEAKAGIGVHFSNKNTYKFDDISLPLNLKNPTNNTAELYAILTAINTVKDYNNKLIIYTDSEYCIMSITKWYEFWVSNNKVKGKKHIDLIKQIYDLYKSKTIQFIHIKAHTGIKDEHSLGNEQADYLAKISLVEK